MLGFLLVDKPQGCTSHDVVHRLKRMLGGVRVGHAGTLDPMATGLLVCGIGQATRALGYLQAYRKSYEGTMRLGRVTDTQDITGATLDHIDGVAVGRRVVELAAQGFVGPIQQVPPAYSAVKLGGLPSHRRMRRGMEYTPPPAREVHIYTLDVLNVAGADVRFCVTCSSGTYIRTLCHDWGATLNTGGCLAALRRTRVEHFSVQDAVELDKVDPEDISGTLLHTLADALPDWPRKTCTPEETEAAVHGQAIRTNEWDLGTRICLTLPSGDVFALAQVQEDPAGPMLKAAPVFTSVLDSCADLAS